MLAGGPAPQQVRRASSSPVLQVLFLGLASAEELGCAADPEPGSETLGLSVEALYVSDLNGFQPVVDVESLDSAVLLGTVEPAESSEMSATIDVDPAPT